MPPLKACSSLTILCPSHWLIYLCSVLTKQSADVNLQPLQWDDDMAAGNVIK